MSTALMTPDEWNTEAARNSPITTEELDKLGKDWSAAWAAHDEVEVRKKELYALAMEVDGKLVEALKLAGKSKYVVEGVGTFSVVSKLSVQTPKTIADKQLLAKFLEDWGGKTLFWDKFGINSQTLQSMYKEIFEQYKAKCEESGDMDKLAAFSIPGLGAPTAMESLRLTAEKNK